MATELAKAYVQIIPSARGIQDALGEELGAAGDSAGSSSGEKFNSAFGERLKTGLATVAKVGFAAVSAAAAGIAALGTQSVKLYSDYEQLVGGVETLFGAGGASLEEYAASVGKTVSEAEGEYDALISAQNEVMANARDGWKNVGLSTNEYMETVTSFSASLIKGLGGDTQKAAEIADMAITDMADNANKMGTDMEMIQNAYQGFAKQNYDMLDNLKLGYGGTQSEMARLINDSGVLGDAMEVTAETVNQVSFDKMIEAIHVIQDEMGITEAAAEESFSTIQGSISSMSAAWENFLTGMADPEQDFDALLGNLVESIVTVGDNLIPRIQMLLPQLAQGLTQLIQSLLPQIPMIMQTLLPTLITGATSLINGFTAVLPSIISTAMTLLPQLTQAAMTIMTNLISALILAAPQLLGAGAQMLSTLLTGLSDALPVLLEQIPTMVESGLAVLTEQMPLVLSAGMELLSSLTSGIINTLPDLIAQLPLIIDSFVSFMLDNLPSILESGVEILLSLASGIISSIPQLVSQLPQIITSITTNLAGSLPTILQTGTKLLLSLASGIIQAIPQLVSQLPQIIQAIVSGIGGLMSSVVDIGAQIVNGIWQGIQNAISWFTNQVTSFFSGIIGSVKKVLGISSPSKVFASIGGYMAEGLGSGWSKEYKGVSRGLLAEVDSTTRDMSGQLGNALTAQKIGADLSIAAGKTSNPVENLISAIDDLGDRIEKMKIYLDSGKLVGGIVNDMNAAIGRIQVRQGRTA